MSSDDKTPGLSSDEYKRRKEFLDNMKGLTTSEYIELVQILEKNNVQMSVNTNGYFLNLCQLPQDVFDSIEKFLHFTQTNRTNLQERDTLLSTLTHKSEAK
jgi:hypothetical protein